MKNYIIALTVLILQACNSQEPVNMVQSDPRFKLGDELLLENNLSLIEGKHIALVANKASVLSDGTPLLDTLLKLNNINIDVVFTPEHGYNIDASAGTEIPDSSLDGLRFYSLYGKNKKPSAEMLNNLDLILFDLQDLGVRFYTYTSTLYYVLQAAAENNIPVVVLDRPDPIGGNKVEGPVLNQPFQSFVGIAPIPVVYGMTIGELALLFNGEGMFSEKPELKVIKMENWKREGFFNDYLLKWIPPSPNIPDLETALIYPSTAFLEGTNVSEGRGTEKPFRQIGAPFINSRDVISELRQFQLKGISIEPVRFIPSSISGKAESPKFKDLNSNGILISITDIADFKPMEFSILLLYSLQKLYPKRFKFEPAIFDRLMGESYTREMLSNGKLPSEIINAWNQNLEKFLTIRNKYLLY